MNTPENEGVPTPEQLAVRLEELLNGLRVSVSAFAVWFWQSMETSNPAERIKSQTVALELLEDVNAYLPALSDTETLLRFALLGMQEMLTEKATKEDEQQKGKAG